MKEQVKKVLGIFMAMAVSIGGTAFADSAIPEPSGVAASVGVGTVTPRYVAITSCARSLTLGSLGLLTCKGSTTVRSDYTAYVKVELQQYDGGWNTIETWTDDATGRNASVNVDKYVTSGKYRLKVTHKAYSGITEAESTILYSNTVTY